MAADPIAPSIQLPATATSEPPLDSTVAPSYTNFATSEIAAALGYAPTPSNAAAASTSTAEADIRDFPQIMKNIARAKRKKGEACEYAPPDQGNANAVMMPLPPPTTATAGTGLDDTTSQSYPSGYSSYPSYLNASGHSSLASVPPSPNTAGAGLGDQGYPIGYSSYPSYLDTSAVQRPSPHMASTPTNTTTASVQTAFDRIFRQHQEQAMVARMRTAGTSSSSAGDYPFNVMVRRRWQQEEKQELFNEQKQDSSSALMKQLWDRQQQDSSAVMKQIWDRQQQDSSADKTK